MGCRRSSAARRSPFRRTSPRAYRKRSKQDKARFLNISEGSLEECRYCLILTHRDLGHLDRRSLWQLTDEIGRLPERIPIRHSNS